MTPGLDFDRHRGKTIRRFSLAGVRADIVEGLRRLEDDTAVRVHGHVG